LCNSGPSLLKSEVSLLKNDALVSSGNFSTYTVDTFWLTYVTVLSKSVTAAVSITEG
jgi:hypothetical protein